MRLRDLPEGERPRERFLAVGPASLSQRELLAILLGTGTGRKGVTALADELLGRFGGLSGLARASVGELRSVHGLGEVKAIQLKTALELGKRLMLGSAEERPLVRTPSDAAQLLMAEMGLLDQEEVRTLLLDTRNRVIGVPMIYRGSLNAASMRTGELFREAIRANAASVVVAHNHPSGDPTPSAEDVRVTRVLIEAGKMLEVEVLDHIIVGHNRYTSLKERGLGFD